MKDRTLSPVSHNSHTPGMLMDDRVERLWDKAEAAIDRGDIDQAEEYRYLANLVAYRRRQEAKDLNKTLVGP